MSLEGQRLGEFEILERLGQGGMGAVYKARQVTLDRLVALKTLQAVIAADPEYIARFSREAKAAAVLNHPNLVQVYSAGENDGLHWFAMEYVEGESAQDRLKRKGRLDPEEAIAIATHVATALDYGWRKAHLIHRDIKPDNIFLSTDGEVKLGDLGLAKSAGESQSLTVTGSSMGTPNYVSPEQGQGKKDVDLRADIYSLGCTLFHLVSGQPPFKGDTALAVMMQHVTAPVPNLRNVWPECPEELARVVMKMMLKQPAARQQSYAEVIADLRRAYDTLTGATMPARVDVTQQPAAKNPAQRQSPAARKPAVAKKRTPVGALATTGLALLAGIAALFYFSPWKKGGRLSEAERAEKDRIAPGKTSAESESGFVPLFGADGTKDWKQTGTGATWKFADGVLSCRSDAGAHTTRLRPAALMPADFEIRFAVRGDSGSPGFEFRGNQAPGASREDCYALHPVPVRTGGHVFYADGGIKRLAKAGERVRVTRGGENLVEKTNLHSDWKEGGWNDVSLVVQGNHYVFACNGVVEAEVFDDPAAHRESFRQLGFRLTNNGDAEVFVEFKDIRIKSLAPGATAVAASVDPASGFIPVFGADGIRDWQQQGSDGKWDYAGGVLSCRMSTKRTARLRCPKGLASADFEIRFAVRGERGTAFEFRGNAGALADCYVLDPAAVRSAVAAFFDGKQSGPLRGRLAGAGQRTRIARDGQPEELSRLTPLPKWKDGDWNEVTLTVQGNRFSTTCNGVLVAEVTDESPSYRAGPGDFGFRVTNITDGDLLAEFKDIRIKLLAPGATSGTAASNTSVGTATKENPFVNTLGMKFVPVPGTQVLFSIWDTRVKDYAEFAKVRKVDDRWMKQETNGVPISQSPECPVVSMNWEDANAFCQWLTEKERAEGKLPQGMKYRLPTDEEWSRAVGLAHEEGATPKERSGKNKVDYPWGIGYPPKGKAGNYADETFHAKFPNNNDKEKYKWIEGYTDGFATTSPVGSFAPNQHGLYDMGGNVWQWCEDLFAPGTTERGLRGASWTDRDASILLSSSRHRVAPGWRDFSNGFRCVLSESAR